MIACTVGARSKNSNLSHHQQRGIVTTSSPSILWDVSQIIFCDFVFKIKFNIFLISKLMDTFPELANSCVKFKIRFVERSMEAWWQDLHWIMRRGPPSECGHFGQDVKIIMLLLFKLYLSSCISSMLSMSALWTMYKGNDWHCFRLTIALINNGINLWFQQ